MIYFITLAAVVFLCFTAGSWLGRRLPGKPRISNSVALGVVGGICDVWFGAAWLAHPYSDGDRPGWQLAEWYAHAGKWWVLLVGAVVGHGVAQSSKQIPSSLPRRILYWSALLIVVSLVGWRTIPVYFLLPAGQERRD